MPGVSSGCAVRSSLVTGEVSHVELAMEVSVSRTCASPAYLHEGQATSAFSLVLFSFSPLSPLLVPPHTLRARRLDVSVLSRGGSFCRRPCPIFQSECHRQDHEVWPLPL